MILGNKFFAGVLVGFTALLVAFYLHEKWMWWPT